MNIMDQGLSFDDVLLLPRKSSFESRFGGEIDLSTEILPGHNIKYPIISANMDTVTEFDMCFRMWQLGGLGIIHRFLTLEQQREQLYKMYDRGLRVLCVGVGENAKARYQEIQDIADAVLIDVAHGHSDSVIDMIRYIKSDSSDKMRVIAGNVATYYGAADLFHAGADCVKVGVGPGSLCTTRVNTGCGVPQLTAIEECYNAVREYRKRGEHKTIIADGGIKNSGDIIKALAAGADAVMLGSLLAGTKEAPGHRSEVNGVIVKKYRGMASKEFQEEVKGKATSIEGEAKTIPYKGEVGSVVEYLINGILSGMSYQNARNLDELRKHARFIRQSSLGLRESVAHGLI